MDIRAGDRLGLPALNRLHVVAEILPRGYTGEDETLAIRQPRCADMVNVVGGKRPGISETGRQKGYPRRRSGRIGDYPAAVRRERERQPVSQVNRGRREVCLPKVGFVVLPGSGAALGEQ